MPWRNSSVCSLTRGSSIWKSPSPQRRRRAGQEHPLPDASRQHPLPHRGKDRLLRACQQPCAGLGAQRIAGDFGGATRSRYPDCGRGSRRYRGCRTGAHRVARQGPGTRIRVRHGEQRCVPGLGRGQGWRWREFPAGLSAQTVDAIARQVGAAKRAGDLVVASIHWGPNWGFAIPREQRDFAHRLVDAAGVDIVHGHSSHHPMAIEIHRGKPILYGCGDLLNDYEGISGYEAYRAISP